MYGPLPEKLPLTDTNLEYKNLIGNDINIIPGQPIVPIKPIFSNQYVVPSSSSQNLEQSLPLSLSIS